MSAYGVDNDRRIWALGEIIAFSMILCYCLNYYVLTPYVPGGPFNILLFFLSVTLLSSAIIFFFNPLIFRYCGIRNNSGIYKGSLRTSYDGCEKDISVTMDIKQTLFDMTIKLKSEKTSSKNNTAYVECGENRITYTYMNEGSSDTSDLKMHRGTCVIEISEEKLIGTYYNDLRNRVTFGSFELKKALY